MIAFRLAAHHLVERAKAGALDEATGSCGVQDSPPGSALLSLDARAEGATASRLEAALNDERTLLRTWSMRGAPYIIPVAYAATFTTGVLPPTDASLRHFILGAGPDVDRVGLSLSDAVELAAAEIPNALTGRKLPINELGIELAQAIARQLPAEQRRLWGEEGPHAKGQPLGEAIVHFCLRILALQGVVCFAARAGNKAPFVLTDEWVKSPLPAIDPQTARAELLRRYLHCYGPSTPAAFTSWLGVQTNDADHWWGLLEDELIATSSCQRRTSKPFGRRLAVREPYCKMARSPARGAREKPGTDSP